VVKFRILSSCFFFGLLLFNGRVNGQEETDTELLNGLFLTEIEEIWQQSFRDQFCLSDDTAFWNVNAYEPNHVPPLDTALVYARLRLLDAQSPMDLKPNEVVLEYIHFYASRRKEQLGRMLGMSTYYFPLFEEKLDKTNLPLELKYLPIVESALNPQARSRVGASGLWQFMLATGNAYGLEVNSYIDQRMDPVMSTEAACKYLEKLYSLYGEWNLALAAYNAGPGNVNKAIRRSGGKNTYWEVRPFLPKETRGYVPAFIAVNYLMNFHDDHNIIPAQPKCSWHETDTIVLQTRLQFDQLEAHLPIDKETLSWYNPTYRKGVIPADGRRYSLRLPYDLVAGFIQNQDSIVTHVPEAVVEEISTPEPTAYRVKSGDSLGLIAKRYGVTVAELKAWNRLRSNMLHPGQKLTIYGQGNNKSTSATVTRKEQPETSTTSQATWYTVKRGDTIWKIASNYSDVSVEQIQRLNAGLNAQNLKLGQKIRIR